MSLVPMYPDSDDNSGNPSPNSGAEAANDDLMKKYAHYQTMKKNLADAKAGKFKPKPSLT